MVPTFKKTIGASDTMFKPRPIKLDEIRPKNNLLSNFGKHAIRLTKNLSFFCQSLSKSHFHYTMACHTLV